MKPAKCLEDRYSIEPDTGCWLWLGSKTSKGYGMYQRRGKTMMAHRFTYELLVGPIPEGLEIDHLCRRRGCVNPKHLEPVTHSVNMLRHSKHDPRMLTDKCKHGHILDGKRTRPTGGRWCRTCHGLGKIRYRQKKKMIALQNERAGGVK